MRKVFLSFVCLLLISKAFCQEKVILNWVISVDEDIILYCEGAQFNLSFKNGKDSVIYLGYLPGSLSVKKTDFDLIKADSVATCVFLFSYNADIKNKYKSYNYSIEIEKGWINDYYFVLRIFNLDKKKYRQRFRPFQAGANYTFEFDLPGFSFRRISK